MTMDLVVCIAGFTIFTAGFTAWMDVTDMGFEEEGDCTTTDDTVGMAAVEMVLRVDTTGKAGADVVTVAGEDGAEEDRANFPASVRVRVWRPELITLSIMLDSVLASSGSRVMP